MWLCRVFRIWYIFWSFEKKKVFVINNKCVLEFTLNKNGCTHNKCLQLDPKHRTYAPIFALYCNSIFSTKTALNTKFGTSYSTCTCAHIISDKTNLNGPCLCCSKIRENHQHITASYHACLCCCVLVLYRNPRWVSLFIFCLCTRI